MREELLTRCDELIAAGRFLFERGWVPATSGNLSARLSDGRLALGHLTWSTRLATWIPSLRERVLEMDLQSDIRGQLENSANAARLVSLAGVSMSAGIEQTR
jgi:ribulose-5-phosphate 4-epimerase/fuculose-1-phosphate aldolase